MKALLLDGVLKFGTLFFFMYLGMFLAFDYGRSFGCSWGIFDDTCSAPFLTPVLLRNIVGLLCTSLATGLIIGGINLSLKKRKEKNSRDQN
jgi:hypothetical protein